MFARHAGASLLDSAEIDNANVQLRTVYELTRPGTTKTHERCRTYLDRLNGEIELLDRKAWPSHRPELRRLGKEGRAVMASTTARTARSSRAWWLRSPKPRPSSAARPRRSVEHPPDRAGAGDLRRRQGKDPQLVDPARCRMWARHNRDYDLLDEASCADLLESLRAQGEQEFPAIVRRVEDDPAFDYEVICGARRHWAVS